MTKWFNLLFLAFFIRSFAGACQDGVLRCNTLGDSPEPEICDFPRGFVLNPETKTCELRPIDGCEIQSFNRDLSTCFLCKAGKITDAENKSCIDVTGEQIVENCDRYNPLSPHGCAICKEGFFVFGDTCNAVGEEKVTECLVYSGENVCQQCKNGFYLKENKCLEIQSVEHCKNHTLRQCVACENGYYFDVSFEAQLAVNSGLFQMILGGDATATLWSPLNNLRSVCTKEIVENCLIHQAHNKCKTCLPNYFLNVDYRCERFPEDPIPHCKLYTNGTTCLECEPTHFLSANKCTIRTKADNCDQVEVESDQCKKCVSSHFLKGDFTCAQRLNSEIQSCETFAHNKDECLKCVDKNSATQDMLKCMADIEHCNIMTKGVNKDATSHTCSTCADTHFLDTNKCLLRTVENCKTYQADKNDCTACNDTHYLDAKINVCNLRNVDKCLNYVPNTNLCLECLPDYYGESVSSCVVVTKEHCVEYTKNTNDCTKCKEGYYADNKACVKQNVSNCIKHVENENKCEICEFRFYDNLGSCAAQNLSHCVEYEQGKNDCMTCAAGYFVDSKACQAVSKDNCLAYTANTNTCTACSPMFNLSNGACAPNTVSNCIKYEANTNNCTHCAKSYELKQDDKTCVTPRLYCKTEDGQGVCTECDAGYYLDGSKDCIWQDLDNCVEYKANENYCTKCGPNFYDTAGTCTKSAKTNCLVHTENTETCVTCISGFYADGGNCTAQSVTNCVTHVPNSNTCADCEPDFYIDGSTECTAKSVADCVELKAGNENKCTKCKSLFAPNVDNTACTAFADGHNCLESTGLSTDCSVCTNGFLLDTGACTSPRDVSKVSVDCTGNTESVANTKCAQCGNDKVVIEGTTPSKSAGFMTTNNCAQINTSGVCIQCAELYEMKASVCTKSTDLADLRCIQVKQSSVLPLIDNDECVKCVDNGAFFLEGETCTHRADHAGIKDCGKWDPIAKECLQCKPGLMSGEANSASRCHDPNNMNSSFADNCDIHDDENDICLICSKGYYLNGADVCTAYVESDVYDPYPYTEQMEPRQMSVPSFPDRNCAKISQAFLNSVACVKCKTGFVLSVTQSTIHTFSLDNALGTPGIVNSGGECMAESKAAKWNNGSTDVHVTAAGECAVGETRMTSYFTCSRCSTGKIGSLITTDLDDVGTRTNGPFSSLVNCTTATGMENPYQLINPESTFDDQVIPPDIYFPFTRCTDTTKSLLYMYVFNMSTGALSFQNNLQQDGTPFKQAYCVESSNFAGVASNCAFYVLKANVPNTQNFATLDYTNTTCGACMPGYAPDFEANGDFKECVEILNCTTTDDATNTWLNACQTPTNGSWLEISRMAGIIKSINFALTIDVSQKMENCYVINKDGSPDAKCVFCKEGFEANEDGVCVSIIYDGDACDIKIGKANLTLSPAPLPPHKSINYNLGKMVRLLAADDKYKGVYSGECVKCKYGLKPFVTLAAPKVCAVRSPPPGDLDVNCDVFNFGDDSCLQCKNNKSLNKTTSACESPALTNCIKFNPLPANAQTCEICEEGYALDGSNACVATNCELMDGDKCLVCKETYHGSTSQQFCSTGTPLAGCARYSASEKACVKCTDAGKIPYNVKSTFMTTITLEEIHCVDLELTGRGFGDLNLEYPFVEIILDQSDYSHTSKLKFLETPEQKTRMFTKTAPTDEPADTLCVPNFDMTIPCSTRDGFFCTSCAQDKVLNSTGVCAAQDNKGCKDLKMKTTFGGLNTLCSECIDPQHYVDLGNAAICIVRVNFNHCKSTEPTNATCSNCNDGKWNNAGACTDYTVQNCNEFDRNANECTSCKLGFYLDAVTTKSCLSASAKNCASMKQDVDECVDCMEGFVKNGANECVRDLYTNCDTIDKVKEECSLCKEGFLRDVGKKTCTRRTATNCKDYEAETDKCSVCEKGFVTVPLQNNCMKNEAKNCQNFDAVKSECEFCGSIYQKDTLDSNKCKMKTATYCTAFEVDMDQCVDCAEGWYKDTGDSNKCKLMSVENCLENITNKNECKKCRMGYIVDSDNDNVCKANSALNCLRFNETKHECIACVENFWLDDSDPANVLCKANTAENCKTKANDMNECVDCQDGFWQDGADGNKCKALTAENCKSYDKVKNMCDKCNKDFLRVVDSKSLVTCVAYTATNCLTYNISKDQCATCVEGFWYKVEGDSITCAARANTADCKRVNPDLDSCDECNNTYYLDAKNVCVASKVVSNCKTYNSMKEDKCKDCNEGYYKSLTVNECWLYPDGIANCAHYDARDTCVRCNTTTFLDSNTCKDVTTEVTNCVEYSDAVTCKKCGIDKFLDTAENKCLNVTIQNCMEHETASTCAKCLPKYLLNSETKKCESSNISDCELPKKGGDGTITCEQCSPLKIVSEDKKSCITPPNQVTNCVEYKVDKLCEKCKDMFLLSVDQKTCSDINQRAGPKCRFAKELSEPICDGCRLGYKINEDGKCVQLELEHCYLQNSVTKKCDLCKTGAYMNSDMTCVFDNSEPDRKFQSRLSALCLLALVLTYLI